MDKEVIFLKNFVGIIFFSILYCENFELYFLKLCSEKIKLEHSLFFNKVEQVFKPSPVNFFNSILYFFCFYLIISFIKGFVIEFIFLIIFEFYYKKIVFSIL